MPRVFRLDGAMTTRVLIVDDEESMRTLLRSWVEREGGSTVIEAGTAEEGLEKVLSDSPAVALCDIRLPGEDGLWLAAQIRIHQPQTAVIMTPAYWSSMRPSTACSRASSTTSSNRFRESV